MDRDTEGQGINDPDFYRRMITEIQDYAIVVIDREGFIRNWNTGARKIKQYSEEEMLGKHFSLFYTQADIKNNLPQRLINEATTMGHAVQEGWRKRKDGSLFWASVTVTAIHADDNSVIGFSQVTRDLTEKKSVEEDLRRSEELYHQMIAEVDDYAIILLSEKGIIENWNVGAEKIKGYSSKEIVGRSFEIFYPPEDRADNLPTRLLKQARESGKAVHEGWRIRKDGTRFWGTIVITALHNHAGDIIGFSKVTRDLTERKLSDDRLAAYTRELEIQNSELEQFSYVVSHDLQEPLRKIQIFNELIQKNFKDESFVEKYLVKVSSAASRMADLVRSLLNYSRLSKETAFAEVDLNEVVKDILTDFELLIQEKNATITTEPLPSINGNKTQMGQLFSNMVGNSLKFSRENPLINITSSVVDKDQIKDLPHYAEGDKYLKIIFSDNGIGFEQQYDKVIFSLFQRLHGKQDYSGTGIGLALCKKIVENHNGFITAEGELKKGAKFNVYLPVNQSVVS